jgi:serine/threonine-protein kinase
MDVSTSAPSTAQLHFHACTGRTAAGEAYRVTMTRPGGVAQHIHALVLDAKVNPTSPAIARMQTEVRALSATRLPTLQSILDLVLVDGRVAVLSEAFDSVDLGTLMADSFPLRALLDVIGDVATALDAAWTAIAPDGAQLKLVHQDVRPGTILVGHHGDVRLAHFGLSRALSADMPGGEHSHWLYMAPERFSKGDDRPSGDIYSLGNILYEGLVGRHPFHGKSFTELYPFMRDPAAAEEWLAEQLAQLPYDVPQGVESLVSRMLSVDPARRPSAREVARECDLLGDQVSGHPLKRWARERLWPAELAMPAPLVGRTLDAHPLHAGTPSRPVSASPSIAPPAMLPSQSPASADPFDDPLDAPAPVMSRGPASLAPAPAPRAPTPPPAPQAPPDHAPHRLPTPRPAAERRSDVGLPRVPTPVAAPGRQ